MIVMFVIGTSDITGLNIALRIGGITLGGLSLAILVGIILNAILVKFNK